MLNRKYLVLIMQQNVPFESLPSDSFVSVRDSISLVSVTTSSSPLVTLRLTERSKAKRPSTPAPEITIKYAL